MNALMMLAGLVLVYLVVAYFTEMWPFGCGPTHFVDPKTKKCVSCQKCADPKAACVDHCKPPPLPPLGPGLGPIPA